MLSKTGDLHSASSPRHKTCPVIGTFLLGSVHGVLATVWVNPVDQDLITGGAFLELLWFFIRLSFIFFFFFLSSYIDFHLACRSPMPLGFNYFFSPSNCIS